MTHVMVVYAPEQIYASEQLLSLACTVEVKLAKYHCLDFFVDRHQGRVSLVHSGMSLKSSNANYGLLINVYNLHPLRVTVFMSPC